MQYFRLLPVAAALGIIVPGVYYPAFAEELHSHKASSTKHDRIRDVAAGSFSSIGQAWLALKSAVEASSGLIAAGNLEPIPAKIEKADAAIKYLQNAGGIWDAHKKARAEAILRQLFDLSGDLHEAVNANDAVKAWQTIKVLEAALKLIEIQYPAEALQVSAGTPGAKRPPLSMRVVPIDPRPPSVPPDFTVTVPARVAVFRTRSVAFSLMITEPVNDPACCA
jgi:hypothetical protein